MAKAPTKKTFGREARSGLEQQAAAITPDLTYQTQAQKKAIADRSEQLQQGIARRAGLEGSGLSTGMSGQNIRLMGTIGAQQLAQEAAVEQRAGQEQRANLQALLGAQSMEDQRNLAERQQALRAQERVQQFGLGQRAQTEAETAGAAQRRLAEGQVTGQLSDTLDRDAVLAAYRNPDGSLNTRLMNREGIFEDPVTREFTRRTGTLGGRAQTEAETAGAAQRRLGEAQLTGELEDEEGGEAQRTLAGQQQDIAAQQAQGQLELAERQRQDARDLRFQELGLQSADLTERARQFDADLAERSAQFRDSFGLSADQFLESKRQFDDGIAIEDQKLANQMNQFNAEQRLRAAEMFGGEGISKLEFANSFGSNSGDPGYRRDLDFNRDGTIDAQDEATFDSLADDGVIRGRGTLAQRQQEYQEARFQTEADLQSEALGIDRMKIEETFKAQEEQLNFTMAQFNTAFTGQLFEAGPDGSIMVMDGPPPDGKPVTSTQEKVARNNLQRLQNAMDDSIVSIATEMGLIGANGKNIGDLSDEKMFSLVSLMMANRAPASTNVGYSGRFNQEQPSGWMQALGILGQTAGSVFQGKFG